MFCTMMATSSGATTHSSVSITTTSIPATATWLISAGSPTAKTILCFSRCSPSKIRTGDETGTQLLCLDPLKFGACLERGTFLLNNVWLRQRPNSKCSEPGMSLEHETEHETGTQLVSLPEF